MKLRQALIISLSTVLLLIGAASFDVHQPTLAATPNMAEQDTRYSNQISGTDVTWEIDNGVLKISGGVINGLIRPPWRRNNSVTSIEISGELYLTGSAPHELFSELPQVGTIDLSNLNTESATTMYAMFYLDPKLTQITFGPNFQTANVIDMRKMFQETGFTSINLSSFDTSQATNMGAMFAKSPQLSHITFGPHFVTSRVRNTNTMFHDDSALTSLDLSQFDLTHIPQISSYNSNLMFLGTTSLWKIRLGEKTKLNSNMGLPDVPGDKRPMPENGDYINASSEWVPIKGGTDYAPNNGDTQYTSDQLMSQRPPEEETYVWKSAEDLSAISVKPEINLIVGETWNPQEGFVSATDMSGNPIDFSDVTVSGDPVDTAKPGTYNVVYTYGDRSATTKVIVSEDQASLNVKPEIDLTVGDQWQDSDGFISAVDKYGNAVTFENIKVTGDKVNTAEAGTYKVIYTLGDLSKTTTVVVKDKTTPPAPNPDPTPSPNPQPVPNPQPQPETQPEPNPTTPATPPVVTQPVTPIAPILATKVGAAVYGVNSLYLYKKADFVKSQRVAKYVKKPRISRPMFIVTDYARSTNGKLRYKVRDVNTRSKTFGKVGYITANQKYVQSAYYQTMPKNNQIRVISLKGIHTYKNQNLTGRVKTYKEGTRLIVKKIVKHNLTTRYQLKNGLYITGNKKFIIHGQY